MDVVDIDGALHGRLDRLALKDCLSVLFDCDWRIGNVLAFFLNILVFDFLFRVGRRDAILL